MAEVKRGAYLKLLALAILLIGGTLIVMLTPVGGYLSRDGVERASEWLRGSTAAPLIYMATYALATAMAIPGSILTLAGGAMFGITWGTLYTTIGANIGANAAFAIARFLGRDGIEKLAGKRLEAMDRATKEYGFRGLLMLRLIPVAPFNALNFGSGLTSISWPTYALATVIGIFPGTIVYTMFADALLAGSQEASREALIRVLLSGALLILLSFLPVIVRRLGLRHNGASAALLFALVGMPTLGTTVAYAQDAPSSVPTHEAFTSILAKVVRQPNVDYERLAEERPALDIYLRSLGDVDLASLEGANREVQLAFWINAYNACMLTLVADHYPIAKNGRLISRLRNAVAGRPTNSVWQIPDVFTVKHCRIAGEVRSQDDIEHGMIRPMGEPRIHFAVNCAAVSCPALWPEAYEAARLAEQLGRAVSHLIGSEQHFVVEGATVRLNKVLDWFVDDFGGTNGLRTFLAAYASEEAAGVLRDARTTIEYFDYDWTLNDIPR